MIIKFKNMENYRLEKVEENIQELLVKKHNEDIQDRINTLTDEIEKLKKQIL